MKDCRSGSHAIEFLENFLILQPSLLDPVGRRFVIYGGRNRQCPEDFVWRFIVNAFVRLHRSLLNPRKTDLAIACASVLNRRASGCSAACALVLI